MDAYCQRDFLQYDAVEEAVDGSGRETLSLRHWPVRAVTEVRVDGVVVAASDYRVRVLPGGGNAGILERRDSYWPRGWENVVVTYDAGYVTPPAPVRAVVEDLVVNALLAAAKNQRTQGASTVGMDGFSVTYGVEFATTNPLRLDDAQKARLSPYRRVVAA